MNDIASNGHEKLPSNEVCLQIAKRNHIKCKGKQKSRNQRCAKAYAQNAPMQKGLVGVANREYTLNTKKLPTPHLHFDP